MYDVSVRNPKLEFGFLPLFLCSALLFYGYLGLIYIYYL